jgi:hypothetical protein
MTTIIIIYGCARLGEVDVSRKLAFDVSLKLQFISKASYTWQS